MRVGSREWYLSTLREEFVQEALNDYLSDYPYLDGYTPSQADVTVFKALSKLSIDLRHKPHLRRWKNHISTFGRNEKTALRPDSGELFSRCSEITNGKRNEDSCAFQVGKLGFNAWVPLIHSLTVFVRFSSFKNIPFYLFPIVRTEKYYELPQSLFSPMCDFFLFIHSRHLHFSF